MMTFYRNAGCNACESLEETLKELCIAYKIVVVDEKMKDKLPASTRAPVLVDGQNIIQGNRNIATYLEKLEGFKALWEKFQSDVCYCDEDE